MPPNAPPPTGPPVIPAGTPPYATPYAPPYALPARRSDRARPTTPVEYEHALRGPLHHWVKALVSPMVLIGLFLVLMVVFLVVFLLAALASGVSPSDEAAWNAWGEDQSNPVVFALSNLLLAGLIPVVMLTTWIVSGQRPGIVSSVAGRFRWRWAAVCALVAALVWGVVLGLGAAFPQLLGGDEGGSSERPSTWLWLIGLTLLTTPLQAAGEEYLFRGWVMQWVGSFVPSRIAAIALSCLVSAAAFASAHGSFHVWILLDLAVFAVAAVLLTWRTGGLEAACALHAVNNIAILATVAIVGGFDEAFVQSDTTGSPVGVLTTAIPLAVMGTAIWVLAGRLGIDRRTTPQEARP